MKHRNELNIGQALEQMVDELNLRGKLDESRIRTAWSETMGAGIAKYTSSISLTKRCLYIKVESAALKHELNYERDKIKELLNKALGGTIVERVVVF